MDFFVDPETLAKILGFSIGFLWGEAFSKFDFKVKYASGWFKALDPFKQWFIASLLDTQHHFQYGLALMLLAQTLSLAPLLVIFVYFLGLGLVISDLKDYEYVLSRLGLSQKVNASEGNSLDK